MEGEVHSSSERIPNFPEVDVSRELSRIYNICKKVLPDLKAVAVKDKSGVHEAIVSKLDTVIQNLSKLEDAKLRSQSDSK